MNLRNCRQCGQVFNYMAGNMICPKCREEAEKKFQEVKDYLRPAAAFFVIIPDIIKFAYSLYGHTL